MSIKPNFLITSYSSLFYIKKAGTNCPAVLIYQIKFEFYSAIISSIAAAISSAFGLEK